MRFLIKLLFLLLLASPLLLAGAVWLMIDAQPTVNRTAEITPANIERAKRILDRIDPRKLKSGTVQTITVSHGDFDLAVNYLAHQYARGSARVVIRQDTMGIGASVRLPRMLLGRFVNIEAVLSENTPLPRFEFLRVGRLALAGWMADWILSRALVVSLGSAGYDSVTGAIKKVAVGNGRLAMTYIWQADIPDKLRTALVPPSAQERLRLYQSRLADVSHELRARNVSLTTLLVPLFKLAEERSRRGNAAAENRAAILVLTLHVNGKSLISIAPAAHTWPRPTAQTVTLNGRHDFAQHFTVSATLAAHAGSRLADAAGLYKEIADARGGSGFSFNDIAADRAGTRFGERAAENTGSAATLQQRLSAGISEQDIMPDTADLPEFMPEAEFKRRFGGIGAPAYKQMMAEIERRIAALAVYR
jgi:hypothetical protein